VTSLVASMASTPISTWRMRKSLLIRRRDTLRIIGGAGSRLDVFQASSQNGGQAHVFAPGSPRRNRLRGAIRLCPTLGRTQEEHGMLSSEENQ
jgi:hypothetical protein